VVAAGADDVDVDVADADDLIAWYCDDVKLSCMSRSGVTATEPLSLASGDDNAVDNNAFDDNATDDGAGPSSWCGELRLAKDFTNAYQSTSLDIMLMFVLIAVA